ncbi:MAG TPA: hypothetical protein VMU48_20015 [Terracidiphilus sp.]|nr:hypothetical protein [Terracidiphilus sp.]
MATDPTPALTVFLTQMVGLSVAAERVTETIKQWTAPAMSKLSASRTAALVQSVAILSGVFVTALSGLNPLSIPGAQAFDWFNHANWLNWFVSGILVSGGSAFWNHLLDILQAVKVQREQLTQNLVSTSAAVSAAALAVSTSVPALSSGPAGTP